MVDARQLEPLASGRRQDRMDRRRVRRLRIFGQRDKLKANRSKRGVRWA